MPVSEMRSILKLNRDETTLVGTIGLCFACAFVAYRFGYSVALGAFIGFGGQLQRALESFRLMVESVSDYAIVMLDPQGRFRGAGYFIR